MSTGNNTKKTTKKKTAPKHSCKTDCVNKRIVFKKGGGSLDSGPNKPK